MRGVDGSGHVKRLIAALVVAGICATACGLPAHPAPAGAEAARQASGAPVPADIVTTARAHLGDRYATIGNSPATGFSCIGFVNYVFGQNGVAVPFDIPAAWGSAPHVAIGDLLPGDVLFFSNTVFAGLSHVAIYIGGGEMIGADNFSVGVTTDRLGDSYWAGHYTGATRPLAQVGTGAVPGSGNTGVGSWATATPPSGNGNAGQGTAATPTASPQRGNSDTGAPPTAVVAPALQVAAAPGGTRLRTRAAAAGMYSGPGPGYTPIATLGLGSTLIVLRGQGRWYDVRLGDLYGWVRAGDVGPVAWGRAFATPATAEATPGTTPARTLSRALATSSAAGGVLYVADGPLTIRVGPGTDFPAIGYLQQGTRLLVRESRQAWAHVATPAGMAGWVAERYLGRAAPAPSPRAGSQAPGSTARVAVPALNVRLQPDARARVLAVLRAGEAVQVLARDGGWDRIELPSGTVGWASADWLSDRAGCDDRAGACPLTGR